MLDSLRKRLERAKSLYSRALCSRYLCFCTSKASKLACANVSSAKPARCALAVFVLLYSLRNNAYSLRNKRQYLYFCTRCATNASLRNKRLLLYSLRKRLERAKSSYSNAVYSQHL